MWNEKYIFSRLAICSALYKMRHALLSALKKYAISTCNKLLEETTLVLDCIQKRFLGNERRREGEEKGALRCTREAGSQLTWRKKKTYSLSSLRPRDQS